MAIDFTSEIQNNVLIITSSGEDETLDDVKLYAADIIETGVKSGCSKALIDERNLKYKLGTIDTFQLAEFTASNAPNIGKIAIVPNAEGVDDLSFWETVVTNRGLRVKACPTIEEAMDWLGFYKPIEFDIKIDQDLLIITAFGHETNLDDSEKYISTIVQAAIDTQCEKILIDERQLEYDLSPDDILQLAEFIKNETPVNGKVAIVSKPKYEKELKDLEAFLRSEGEDLMFFIDYNEALEWVNQ
jgi:hypothetical protein